MQHISATIFFGKVAKYFVDLDYIFYIQFYKEVLGLSVAYYQLLTVWWIID